MYVFENYPPSTYPKLYPRPIEDNRKLMRNIKTMFNFIFLLGLLLLALLYRYSPFAELETDDIVNYYFLVQFIPMIFVEISAFKTFKLMRQADSRSTRMAELQPRHLFDFVSPAIVGIAIIMWIAFTVFVLFMYQTDIYVGNAAINKIVSVAVCNLAFAGIIYWNMYGKKLNPHQSHRDRMRLIELTIKQLIFMSIALIAYLTLDTIIDYLGLSNLVPIFMSLYLQLLAIIAFWGLHSFKMENVDFEVYKEDPIAV